MATLVCTCQRLLLTAVRAGVLALGILLPCVDMDLERSIAEFADAHRRLLNQERQAEIEETRTLQESVSPQELERMGLCLLRLAVANVHTGLGGRAFVELTSRGGGELDPGRMTPGDIVSIRSHGAATAKRAAPKKAALKGESRPFVRKVMWTEISQGGAMTKKEMLFMNPHTARSRQFQDIPSTVLEPQFDNVIHVDFSSGQRL